MDLFVSRFIENDDRTQIIDVHLSNYSFDVIHSKLNAAPSALLLEKKKIFRTPNMIQFQSLPNRICFLFETTFYPCFSLIKVALSAIKKIVFSMKIDIVQKK